MASGYSIELAQRRHAEALPGIELAAAALLTGHAPIAVLEEATGQDVLLDAIARRQLWVALAGDVPVGFAHVEMLAEDLPHLAEIDVHPAHGRRGVGTRLVQAVCAWAASAGHEQVTLTTFRQVPWNMRWYARLGFVEIPSTQWRPELQAQVNAATARGLDPAHRVVMSYRCSESPSGHAVSWCRDDDACHALGAFLADRIYEFNVEATGYDDGRLLAGCIRDGGGHIIAGFNGHTWGGYCELSNVWVDEHHRGRGLGTLLLRAAEAEAIARGCLRVFLATHSFQAPGFYERLGYQRQYAIDGRPRGFADVVYIKDLSR